MFSVAECHVVTSAGLRAERRRCSSGDRVLTFRLSSRVSFDPISCVSLIVTKCWWGCSCLCTRRRRRSRRRRVGGRRCLGSARESKKMVWPGVNPPWRCIVVVWGRGGFTWPLLLESPPWFGLYLWTTWLLMRPGNVCSVSVLNEPPRRNNVL